MLIEGLHGRPIMGNAETICFASEDGMVLHRETQVSLIGRKQWRWVSEWVSISGAEGRGATRITHGRHCTCGACAAEDWSDHRLAPCGVHGPGCPGIYAPFGRAGEYV